MEPPGLHSFSSISLADHWKVPVAAVRALPQAAAPSRGPVQQGCPPVLALQTVRL